MINKNDYENAETILRDILSEKLSIEQKTKLYYLLSECVSTLEDENYCLKKIIKLSPNKYTAEANFRIAKNYLAQNQFKKAKSYFEKIIANPQSKYFERSLFCSAECYFNLQEYKKAIMRYKNFLEFGKTESSKELSQIMIGNSYFQLENYSSAILAYQKALEIAPAMKTVPYILYRISRSYEKKSKFADAIKFYKKIINNYPYSQEMPLAESRLVYLAEHGFNHSSPKMPDVSIQSENHYIVQLAAFLKRAQAETSKNYFLRQGYETQIYEKQIKGKHYFCVGLDPFRTYDEAKYQMKKIKKSGFDCFIYQAK